jgi:hypothetical protein
MGDDYELTIVRLDRSLWSTGWAKTGRNEFKRDLSSSPARPQMTTHKVSARLFTELESAIRRSIEAARVPAETNLADALNLHGVLFRFEVAGSGCGETRPLDWGETEAGKLAAIVLALCNPSDENRQAAIARERSAAGLVPRAQAGRGLRLENESRQGGSISRPAAYGGLADARSGSV